MPRGSAPGERRGGRKKGVPNKKTAALQEQVASTGMTPLEVMLDNMRFAYDQAQELADSADPEDQVKLRTLRGIAQDCAKDAAPYLHPKLTSIEHGGKDGGPIEIRWKADD